MESSAWYGTVIQPNMNINQKKQSKSSTTHVNIVTQVFFLVLAFMYADDFL